MPRGGDCYGVRGKRAPANWGDTASRERSRKIQKRKLNRKHEKKALGEDHPQVCPVCLDDVKTHLVANCGNMQEPGHRYHGFCAQCSTDAVARGICPLCRGVVQGAWAVGVGFFVGI